MVRNFFQHQLPKRPFRPQIPAVQQQQNSQRYTKKRKLEQSQHTESAEQTRTLALHQYTVEDWIGDIEGTVEEHGEENFTMEPKSVAKYNTEKPANAVDFVNRIVEAVNDSEFIPVVEKPTPTPIVKRSSDIGFGDGQEYNPMEDDVDSPLFMDHFTEA